jgi:hypothetical protein
VNAGISFDCSKNTGALLLLRNHSARLDLRNTETIRNYIRDGLDSWHSFARLKGFGEADAPENSIVLVRGCDKSDSWALAAFAERAQNASIFFNGGIYPGSGGMELRGTWKRHTITSAEHRDGSVTEVNQGRRRVDLTNSAIWNALGIEPLSQCIDCLFIRVFRCRRRWGPIAIPLQIKAQAGPHVLPRGLPDDDAGSSVVLARVQPGDEDEEVVIHSDPDIDLVRFVSFLFNNSDLTRLQSQHAIDHLLQHMLDVRLYSSIYVSDTFDQL